VILHVLALLIVAILRTVVSLLKKRVTVASVPLLTKQITHYVAVVMDSARLVSVGETVAVPLQTHHVVATIVLSVPAFPLMLPWALLALAAPVHLALVFSVPAAPALVDTALEVSVLERLLLLALLHIKVVLTERRAHHGMAIL